jgi:ABC-type polysaccharide/polyol phosphate export permease
MVNPLLTMAVLVVVFTNLFQRFNVENYPIYLLSGILLWRLFSGGTSIAMRSVLDGSGLLRKIYIPSSVFVGAAIGSALVNLLFALVPLLLLALVTGVYPKFTWLFLPLPILQTTLFAFGVGLIIAALAVFFADILDIYEVVVNAYFYLTPIIYPISILPEPLAKFAHLNPMYQYIEAFRGSLIEGQPPELIPSVLSLAAALAITVVGWSLFTRLSDQFAYRT